MILANGTLSPKPANSHKLSNGNPERWGRATVCMLASAPWRPARFDRRPSSLEVGHRSRPLSWHCVYAPYMRMDAHAQDDRFPPQEDPKQTTSGTRLAAAAEKVREASTGTECRGLSLFPLPATTAGFRTSGCLEACASRRVRIGFAPRMKRVTEELFGAYARVR